MTALPIRESDLSLHDDADLPRDYILSNKFYDLLKNIALIFLPALGTLYFALAQIWGLGSGEEVLADVGWPCAMMLMIKLGDRSYNNGKTSGDGDGVLTNSKVV